MTTQDIGLFQALTAKMDYLNQRQGVIAQNVANADTPGYLPKDLTPVDFSSMLGSSAGGSRVSVPSVNVDTTDERHLGIVGSSANVNVRAQKDTYEVAPAGNAVIIEEQLINSSKNMMDYSLMLKIYQKQIGMMRMALGKS